MSGRGVVSGDSHSQRCLHFTSALSLLILSNTSVNQTQWWASTWGRHVVNKYSAVIITLRRSTTLEVNAHLEVLPLLVTHPLKHFTFRGGRSGGFREGFSGSFRDRCYKVLPLSGPYVTRTVLYLEKRDENKSKL